MLHIEPIMYVLLELELSYGKKSIIKINMFEQAQFLSKAFVQMWSFSPLRIIELSISCINIIYFRILKGILSLEPTLFSFVCG